MKNIKYAILLLIAVLFVGCFSSADIETFGSLSGVITDKYTQEPISAANVALLPLGKSVTTDENGYYEYLNIESGDYTIEVSKDKYETTSQSIRVEPIDNNVADIQIETENDIVVSTNTLDFGLSEDILSFNITNKASSYYTVYYCYIVASQNEWLSISSTENKIYGKNNSASIVVTIDRNYIYSDQTAKIIISSSGGDSEISVIVDFDETTPILKVSTELLTLNNSKTETSFEISNIGGGDLSYSIATNKDWLSISNSSDVISANGTSVINVNFTPDMVNIAELATISVKSDYGDYDIYVRASNYPNTTEYGIVVSCDDEVDVYISSVIPTLYSTCYYCTVNFVMINWSDVSSIYFGYYSGSFSSSASDNEGGSYPNTYMIIQINGLSVSSSYKSTTIPSDCGIIQGSVTVKYIETSVTYLTTVQVGVISKSSSGDSFDNNCIIFQNVPIK